MEGAQPYIVVVDDEKMIASTLAIILRNNGYSAMAFTRPQEALEFSQQLHPDLLITDMNMPEITGSQLAQMLRVQCPDCPVIFFSGEQQRLAAVESENPIAEPYAFLMKPIHPTILLRTIESFGIPSETIRKVSEPIDICVQDPNVPTNLPRL